MGHEDTTPQGNRNSGEWPVWAAILEEQGRRVEKEVKGLRTEFNTHANTFTTHVGDDKLLAMKVANLEKRQADADSDKRELTVGTKLAIVSAIAGPFITVAALALKH